MKSGRTEKGEKTCPSLTRNPSAHSVRSLESTTRTLRRRLCCSEKTQTCPMKKMIKRKTRTMMILTVIPTKKKINLQQSQVELQQSQVQLQQSGPGLSRVQLRTNPPRVEELEVMMMEAMTHRTGGVILMSHPLVQMMTRT
uniref:Uncharacterized protein n=1 Tax=Cacopsylla melanoneura TaxID=428564 RepID=A0A8D8W892_9HEMI